MEAASARSPSRPPSSSRSARSTARGSARCPGHPGRGAVRGGRRGHGAAVLGAAPAGRPRPLHAPGGPGDHRPARRARHAAHARAGQAARRVLLDGAGAHDRLAALARGGGSRDPRRRARADAGVPQAEALALLVRAARRGGRDRPLELPVVDPLRRGGHRADGRQRRGAEAGVAHPADRPADPGHLRASRPPGGPRAHRPRRRRRGPGARGVQRGEDLLHRLGGGRARRGRGVRPPDEGLGARAGRQGPR